GADYYRVRLGIGRPTNKMNPADFVLQKFSSAESQALNDFSITAAQAIDTLILDGLAKAQTKFND
ncbi:MAG: aminoacyl-tRNA hydrolase, partial [Candidatus Fonsibacter sp.]